MTDIKTAINDDSPLVQANNQATKTSKAKKSKNWRNRPTISQPTISKKITVNTASAQILMGRFARLEVALFVLDVPLLFSRNIHTVEQYQIATDEAHGNLKNELQTALESARKLAENNDISHQGVIYADAKEYTFTIRTPRAIAFLNLILLFDKLIMCVDNLWMNDADLVGGNRNRLEHHQLWSQRLARFFREIIESQINLHKNRNNINEDVAAANTKEEDSTLSEPKQKLEEDSTLSEPKQKLEEEAATV